MIVKENIWSRFKTPLTLFINQANIQTALKTNYANLFSFPFLAYIELFLQITVSTMNKMRIFRGSTNAYILAYTIAYT